MLKYRKRYIKNMIIKDKLIKEFPLTKKIDCSFDCFEVIKRRYVIFYDEKINKENIKSLLDVFNENTNNNFSKKKTLIVVAYTDEEFNKEDLVFFNGVDTFIVYYLINETTFEIYFNDQTMLWFSIDWKKIIKKFNEILKNNKKQ